MSTSDKAILADSADDTTRENLNPLFAEAQRQLEVEMAENTEADVNSDEYEEETLPSNQSSEADESPEDDEIYSDAESVVPPALATPVTSTPVDLNSSNNSSSGDSASESGRGSKRGSKRGKMHHPKTKRSKTKKSSRTPRRKVTRKPKVSKKTTITIDGIEIDVKTDELRPELARDTRTYPLKSRLVMDEKLIEEIKVKAVRGNWKKFDLFDPKEKSDDILKETTSLEDIIADAKNHFQKYNMLGVFNIKKYRSAEPDKYYALGSLLDNYTDKRITLKYVL